MATKQFACEAGDVRAGAATIVTLGKLSVGIFKLDDGYHALLNVCPHRGAALCEGPVCGTTQPSANREFIYGREGEIIRCAWHGWEFDIRSGESLVDCSVKAKTFTVAVENDKLYVYL